MRPLLLLFFALSFVLSGLVAMGGGFGHLLAALLGVAASTAALTGAALCGAATRGQWVLPQGEANGASALRWFTGLAAGSLRVALSAPVFALAFGGLDGVDTPSVLALGLGAAMGLGGTFGLSVASAMTTRWAWAAPTWLGVLILVTFGIRFGVVDHHFQAGGGPGGRIASNFLEQRQSRSFQLRQPIEFQRLF